MKHLRILDMYMFQQLPSHHLVKEVLYEVNHFRTNHKSRYPAFAVDSADVVKRTCEEVVNKLGGRYGCKRFLRDGYNNPREVITRHLYQKSFPPYYFYFVAKYGQMNIILKKYRQFAALFMKTIWI